MNFQLLLYVIGDTLRIEVTDTRSDRLPCPQRSTPDGEAGRGLLLVDALADRWGVAHGLRPRKTAWAELTFPPTESPKPNTPHSGPACAP
ncbi:ATP-binding protein [Streptomyces sp. NPDC001340]